MWEWCYGWRERRTFKHIYISLILRHKPEVVGLQLDKEGYVKVEELIEGVNKTGRKIDKGILERVVKEDKKGRYSYNKERTKIRATQGHSISVDLGLKSEEPKGVLYHGTAVKNKVSIKEKGLQKGQREYVHLTDKKETAIEVGGRYGDVMLYKVDTELMIKDGYKFYRAENGVWLADRIPYKYLVEIKKV